MTTRLGMAGVAALVAWGLKRHYATAGADDLWWILAPTSHLAGLLTGTTFVASPGEGYLAHDRLFLIEASCAGINFLIAAFGMLVCLRLPRATTPTSGVYVVAVSLGAGYVAAVVVNAVRIATAMWLLAHPSALPIVSADTLHRLEGIVIFFGGLLMLHELARHLDRHVAAVEARR